MHYRVFLRTFLLTRKHFTAEWEVEKKKWVNINYSFIHEMLFKCKVYFFWHLCALSPASVVIVNSTSSLGSIRLKLSGDLRLPSADNWTFSSLSFAVARTKELKKCANTFDSEFNWLHDIDGRRDALSGWLSRCCVLSCASHPVLLCYWPAAENRMHNADPRCE